MISIILGTRPEIIKMAPVIRACQKKEHSFSILHTGQHYSYELDRIFFEELLLPLPDYNLDVGSGSHAEQTGKIMMGIEKIYEKNPPNIILVQGDTNTVLAGGLVGAKLHIPVGHIEAGLRSNDRDMPEEINRIVVDHISDLLFAPTKESFDNLIHEGIDDSKVFITGNTVVDSLNQNREIAKNKSKILESLGIDPHRYILVTVHRAENVDNIARLAGILTGIQHAGTIHKIPIIFPMHPRTEKMVQKYGINISGITIISPVGYMDFIELEAHATLIMTDSGGVQEEACILQIPCITLRDNTERPETVIVGANALAGSSPDNIIQLVDKMLVSTKNWENPYGDGTTGERIVDLCIGYLK